MKSHDTPTKWWKLRSQVTPKALSLLLGVKTATVTGNSIWHHLASSSCALTCRYPPLFKVHLLLLHFRRPTTLSVSITKRNPKGIFSFTKKRLKFEIASCICFAGATTEAARIQSREHGPTKLLPWEAQAASQHLATRALSCICEHLYWMSTYWVYSAFYYVLVLFYGLIGIIWQVILGVWAHSKMFYMN